MTAKVATVCVVFLILVFVSRFACTDCRAGETPVPEFGEGKTVVRLYADYFCPPCVAMEPDIEPILTELIHRNIIRLTFVDTPFYRFSSLYARYFLYAMNANKTLDNALVVRNALIEASQKKLYHAQKLETFLNEKKIGLRQYDVKPAFDAMSGYLQKDSIDRTPTCLVEINGKAHKYEGKPDITDALDKLRRKKVPELKAASPHRNNS